MEGGGAGQRFTLCTSLGSCEKPLNIKDSTGEYGYGSGDLSRFYRYVKIDNSDAKQATVTATVGFDTGKYTQKYTTTDYLRNWSPR